MTASQDQSLGAALLAEMAEFASFPEGTQRYIRRSLDVGLGRGNAIARWSRGEEEASRIRAQQRVYRRLDRIRTLIPAGQDIAAATRLMAPLVALSAHDLIEGRLPGFPPYRFLYERLIGASARPWLPAAFGAAASLPQVHPVCRRSLISSLSGATMESSGPSPREPLFIPEWVDKVDLTKPEPDLYRSITPPGSPR